MSRAVFLSAGGDPFIASLVHRLFVERWYDEVDKFYICYNNHAEVPLDVAKEFVSTMMADPKVQLIWHPEGVGNGIPIKEMTLIAKEDLVMLLEDDGFIFTKGKVDECFKRIESGEVDAVASCRGSCGVEVWDAMQVKYNLDYSGVGDKGPNFWPNFFFCKRADLLNTDLNFASKEFTAGVYYPELDHTFTEVNYGDTFVWADIQMRHKGVRFGEVPQYHASPSEIEDWEKKQFNWESGQRPYWLHGGSLSSGLNGYLSGSIPDVSTIGAKMEIETRVAFWTIAFTTTKGFEKFRDTYRIGIELLTEKAELSEDRINRKMNIYRELLQV